MTTDRHDDARIEDLVAAAIRHSAPSGPPQSLVADVLGEARRTRRRPRWLAFVTERPMGRPSDVLVGSPVARAASLALALMLVAVLSGMALVAGGWLRHQDATVVLPAPSTGPSAVAPTPRVASPAPSSGSARLVAYTIREQSHAGRCATQTNFTCVISRIWISNSDGTNAHPLFADPQGGKLLGWSPDGSRFLYHDAGGGLSFIDPSGQDAERIEAGVICPDPCNEYAQSVSWSPDGKRLAFPRGIAQETHTTVVAILDLENNKVTELPATSSTNRSQECWKTTNCEGEADVPRWSRDGSQLVFGRQFMSPEAGVPWTSAAVFTVEVDGSSLRRISPPGLVALDASWSPDGSTLAFIATDMIVNGNHTSVVDMRDDIYTIRADGSDLQRLTNDGTSYLPRWTEAGRLTFVRGTDDWIMNADGSAQTKLDFDLNTLTAAGCVTCLYPDAAQSGGQPAFWQPDAR
ncbi:MAG: hypothetical protein ABI927_08730 [Gaiellaceae bacterium]